jgi:AdoMet-dependent heme synthase
MTPVIARPPLAGEARTEMNRPPAINYALNPMLVYWETTRACPLACRHCRASAMSTAHPLELGHDEGLRLLDQIAAFGSPAPHLVLTGGDPLQRADLPELIAYARSLDIRVSITPAAAPDLTRERLFELKEAGVDSIALSLDGSTAERHDEIRQVPGCFDLTLKAARWAGEAGLPLQINTLLAEETVDDLPAVYELLHRFPVLRWSLFFLIAVGRGKQLNEVSPEVGENLMHWIHGLAQVAPFQIKTTEAPSYRRIAQEHMKEAGMTPAEMRGTSVHRGYGIRDGNGIVFVSHTGKVYPSGFLPLEAGNVRQAPLAEIYRESEVFRKVRDVKAFDGKCGRCEFRKICGGSRARAFAHTGNPAGSDPLCPYEPSAA